MKWFFLLLFVTTVGEAHIGEVLSIKHASDAWLFRNGTKIMIAEGTLLEVGDSVQTENSQVTFILYPKIQMSLVRDTQIILTRHLIEGADAEKTTSLVEFIKGLIRIQVTRDGNQEVDQKIDAKGVSFAVRGTEFEVSSTAVDAELDVFEGEVEVSSPYVATFVPELVKSNEGFRFERKQRKFSRRAFKERIRENRFLRPEELRQRWKVKRESRFAKKKNRAERKGRGR